MEAKRDEIEGAHGLQNFHIECNETISWIHEKAKIIESTEELGNDLTGVMTLQRRLSGMERDLAAIQAKLESLQGEAERLEEEKPDEAEAIREKIAEINSVWVNLKDMVVIVLLYVFLKKTSFCTFPRENNSGIFLHFH